MWLKLCLLLFYISLLFILSRILDAISWCESGYNWTLSRQLLDPMVLSVAKLKALLEQRGVNYEGVVDKSELTSLVEASGQISAEEAELSQEENASSETNFTSGAHFIEQVEDAKDSVWLVQVVSNVGRFPVMSGTRWKVIKEKASKFGIRTGFLDCSLDARYCSQKGWRSPFLLLALPSQFEKKASVALYNYTGSVKETAVFRWVRDKLDEKVERIDDPVVFHKKWQEFSNSALEPEIRAVLFTKSSSAPLFYSALSVKFPGRVKFGLVSLRSSEMYNNFWKHILGQDNIGNFPSYVTYIVEKNYTYGLHPGELYSFFSMEQFLKFLYPCLNDIFIASFCVANVLSWFELFISNCSILKRFRKFIWCVFKYNIAVIMLWLPVIGVFQMPYLDRIPLLALKVVRIFSTSHLGTVLRCDYSFYLNHPLYVCASFGTYLAIITFLCKKYRQVDQNEDNWFSFSQMRTHAYLHPNDFIEPMWISRYDLLGGLDVFSSHLAQPSIWLSPSISMDYIKHLPTWRYCPIPLATRAADNSKKVEMMLGSATLKSSTDISETESYMSAHDHQVNNQSTGVLEKSPHALFKGECDQVLTSSLNQAAVAIESDKRNQSVYNSCHSNACSIPHKSSGSTASQGRMTVSSSEKCTASHNPLLYFPDNANHQCQCNSHKKDCDFSGTSGLAHGKSHSSKPEIHGSLNSNTVTDNNTVSLSSESVHINQAHCQATHPAADLNSEPSFSSSSNGSGFPTGYLESHQCVICLDEYAPLTMLCGLPCGHVFHESCIISWFNREKHFCPMCRWPSYKRHSQSLQRDH